MYVIGFLFRGTHGIGCKNSLSLPKVEKDVLLSSSLHMNSSSKSFPQCSLFSQKYETVHNGILVILCIFQYSQTNLQLYKDF